MRRLAASGDDVARLDLLRVQQPHDIGNIRRFKFREQRHPRDHAPGDDKIATVDLVGESGRTMPIGKATMINPTKIVTAATTRPSAVTGTTSP
jgi:hypothetical protein